MSDTISRHYLRRTARARARELNRREYPLAREPRYTVERAWRGPFRWRVIRVKVKP